MFEDLIGTKKQMVCRKCGSTDIEIAKKIFTGAVFTFKGTRYRRYKQFVRCYSCNTTEIITRSEQ